MKSVQLETFEKTKLYIPVNAAYVLDQSVFFLGKDDDIETVTNVIHVVSYNGQLTAFPSTKSNLKALEFLLQNKEATAKNAGMKLLKTAKI